MPAPASFIKYVDDNADAFIQRLAEAVRIPSVSGEADRRPDVIRMGVWLEEQLKRYGVQTRQVDIGEQLFDEKTGLKLPLPPVIFGRIGDDQAKKTLLIYGHYDVQPAQLSDGWNTEPFELKHDKETDQLIGRGSTDDKGPIMGWLNILEMHHTTGTPLPVNLRFVFEGMEESGSEELDPLIEREAAASDSWFKGVDCVCISDNYWLNTRTPCLTYGLRGITYFCVSVSGPARDLHSGAFGRTIHEPMTDLIYLMSRLVSPDGTILVPGVQEMVPKPTPEEIAIYNQLDFSIDDFNVGAGADVAVSSDKATVLMGRMREPSLSLHGIEGAFWGQGAKTVIPAKVVGKFSLRLVPPQTPENVNPLVIKYVEEQFKTLKSKNKLEITAMHGGKPWVEDFKHWNYVAAAKATEEIYGRTPDLMREGGSIPVTLTFAEALKCNVLLLPMGRGDDGAHSTNEKLDRSNYIQGTKLLGTYLYEIAAIAK